MVKRRYKVVINNLKSIYPRVMNEDGLFRMYLGEEYMSTIDKKTSQNVDIKE